MSWEFLGDKIAHNIMTVGLRIDFLYPPPLSRLPPKGRKINPVIESIVMDLLERGIIGTVPPMTKLFFSHLFVVPKKEGKVRLIIDLKNLNKFV